MWCQRKGKKGEGCCGVFLHEERTDGNGAILWVKSANTALLLGRVKRMWNGLRKMFLTHCGILPKNCHVAPSSLAAQTSPLATRGIAHSTRTEILTHSTRMSHIRNSARPTFYLIRMSHSRNFARPTSHFFQISHSRNSIRPTFHLLRIFHIRRLPPDGRGGRFNFPRQTCPDPSVTLIRRTSVASDSDSSDNLARQILAIRRIHFRSQSKNTDNTDDQVS